MQHSIIYTNNPHYSQVLAVYIYVVYTSPIYNMYMDEYAVTMKYIYRQ